MFSTVIFCEIILIVVYLRRVSNGTLLDRRLPEFDEEIQKPLKPNVLSADAEVKLNVLPNPVKNGGFVTIIWRDIRFPTPKDFIAYYCPFDDDTNHYIDFFHVTESLTWKKGYGHYKVQVYNMRSECIFKYYRKTPSNSQLVVSSQKLAFVGGSAAPLQGHLAMTERPTEMRVMWNSGEGM